MNKLTSEEQEQAYIRAYRDARATESELPDIPAKALRGLYWLAFTTLFDTLAASEPGTVATMPRGYGKFVYGPSSKFFGKKFFCVRYAYGRQAYQTNKGGGA